MSDAITLEMQSIVRRAAEPCPAGDSVGAAILRAARRLQLGYRRARSFWYAEARLVRAEEADRLRAAEKSLIRREIAATRQRIVELEARLNARETHRDDLAGMPTPSVPLDRAEVEPDLRQTEHPRRRI